MHDGLLCVDLRLSVRLCLYRKFTEHLSWKVLNLGTWKLIRASRSYKYMLSWVKVIGHVGQGQMWHVTAHDIGRWDHINVRLSYFILITCFFSRPRCTGVTRRQSWSVGGNNKHKNMSDKRRSGLHIFTASSLRGKKDKCDTSKLGILFLILSGLLELNQRPLLLKFGLKTIEQRV